MLWVHNEFKIIQSISFFAGTPSEIATTPTLKEKKIPASKSKKPPAPRGRPPGSGNKPAASVTPYNSATEGQNTAPPTGANQNNIPPTANFGPPPSFYEQSNAQFPPNFQNKQQNQQIPPSFQNNFVDDRRASNFNENTNCSFDISQNPQQFTGEGNNSQDSNQADAKSYLDISNQKGKPLEVFGQGGQFPQSFANVEGNSQGLNFSQPEFQNNQQSFQGSQSFQNTQAAFHNTQSFNQPQHWSQNEQNDFFSSPFGGLNFNGNNSNSGSSWMKREEKLPVTISSAKSESSNDAKPKINIISDIKLPSMFNPNLNLNSNSADKKIKIFSDIKIEPKKEEESDKEVKSEIKDIVPVVSQPMSYDAQGEIKKEKEEVKLLPLESPAAKSNINSFLNFKDKEDCGIPYDWVSHTYYIYVYTCYIHTIFKFETFYIL